MLDIDQFVAVVVVAIAALTAFCAAEGVSYATWRKFGLVVLPVVSACIVAMMVRHGAFGGPHPVGGVGWLMLVISLTYAPFGIMWRRANVRRELRRRAKLATTQGVGALTTVSEEDETSELADILQMIFVMMGFVGVVICVMAAFVG